MLYIVDSNNFEFYAEKMEQAFRLRHDIFVDEKGWTELRRPDGREIDQFDDENAIHMLFEQDGEVVGYQRMLPTTRPYLLSSIYPHLSEECLPNSPAIWEWTRFAVKKSERKRGIILSPVGNALLSGVVEWGLQNAVTDIVIEMNPLWMLRLLQLHFRVHPLGYVQKIAGEDTVAVRASFNKETLEKLQEVRGDNDPVITQYLQINAPQIVAASAAKHEFV